jgi:WD40 repeat protein
VHEYRRFECDGPIQCVAIDPKEEFLASSSTDGFVRIWPLTGEFTDGKQTLKAVKLLPPYGDIESVKQYFYFLSGAVFILAIKK